MEISDEESNVFVRVMRFAKKGDAISVHAHNFPHLHYVPRGRLRVQRYETNYGSGSALEREAGLRLEARIRRWRDAPGWIFWAPWYAEWLWKRWRVLTSGPGRLLDEVVVDANEPFNFVLIRAFTFHSMVAEQDDSIGHCVFAHRTPQGEVVQKRNGWGQAYV